MTNTHLQTEEVEINDFSNDLKNGLNMYDS